MRNKTHIQFLFGKKLIFFIAIFYMLAALSIYGEEKKTIAVLKFENSTQNKGLDFLARNIYESVTNGMIKENSISVIERVDFNKILKEIELQQTGLFNEQKLIKEGSKLNADFLVFGSYSGSSSNLIVNIKAVEVSSAKVFTSKSITGSIDNILPEIENESKIMAAILSGKDTGSISIKSIPEGADVYLNGNLIGKTPIIGHKTLTGSFEVEILLKGYEDYETEIQVEKEKEAMVQAFLYERIIKNTSNISAAAHYFIPLKNLYDNEEFIYLFAVSHTYNRFNFLLEFAMNYNEFFYEYNYEVPYTEKSEKRNINFYILNTVIQYSPFDITRYLNVYTGLFLGMNWIKEEGYKEEFFNRKLNKDTIFTLGPVLGINILPYSSFGLYIEARYIYAPLKSTRETVNKVNFFGGTEINELKYNYQAVNVGFGFRFSI
ncbi:MAG: FlgO family outer membrane protein [Spirochaetia bacterium]|nr:FlgO family outer membrane protein [Spirochaetia bacterium]